MIENAVSPARVPPRPNATWIVWLAEGCGLGRAQQAPGTWGSLLGLPLVWLLQLSPWPEWTCGIAAVGMFLIGIPVCAAGMRYYQKPDPGHVVFDEIAAFPIVFLLVPLNWWSAPLGFGLFRLFDIAKPWPISRAERIPGATGVMADDTIAGLLAAIPLTLLYLWLLAN
ncbi:MAG: phosphatidylglycerophosphatase A [Planctomycetaceae bacterium]|nr:phosphatidylglycerophosphatase A [Planctomycetaceae bacterium]